MARGSAAGNVLYAPDRRDRNHDCDVVGMVRWRPLAAAALPGRTIRNPVKSTSQIIAENPRMAWAMLGSMLAHASLLAALSTLLLKVPRIPPIGVDGFAASLVARITGAKSEDARSAPAPLPRPPRAAPRAPVVPERPAAILVPPVDADSATDGESVDLSADAGGGEGEADRYRGVSVTETLFQRMLPPAFSNVLLEYPAFFRGTQINRPPLPTNVAMPRYPAAELAALSQTYAWIVIAFFIDEQGNVVAAIPVTGSEGYEKFQDQVATAMRESTFTAGERFGRPVQSFTFQMIEFRQPEVGAGEPLPGESPIIAP
jgi:hypothetical protein